MARYPIQVSRDELRLADTVKLFEGPWGFGIVTRITEDTITVTRPYGSTADFSTSGSVIFLTGQERCRYLKGDTRFPAFEVWSRKELK